MTAVPGDSRRRIVRALVGLWLGGPFLFLLLVLVLWLEGLPPEWLVLSMLLHLPLASALAVLVLASSWARRCVATWILVAYYVCRCLLEIDTPHGVLVWIWPHLPVAAVILAAAAFVAVVVAGARLDAESV